MGEWTGAHANAHRHAHTEQHDALHPGAQLGVSDASARGQAAEILQGQLGEADSDPTFITVEALQATMGQKDQAPYLIQALSAHPNLSALCQDYQQAAGRALLLDIADAFSGGAQRALMSVVMPHTPLITRVHAAQAHFGTDQATLRVVKSATAEERAQLSDETVSALADELEVELGYELLTLTRPEQPVENAAWRVKAALSVWGDDEQAIYALFASLPREVRARLYFDQSALLDGLSASERIALHRMTFDEGALPTEVHTLLVHMTVADEARIPEIVQRAATLNVQGRQLMRMLESGRNAVGRPLTGRERQIYEAQLQRIGDVRRLTSVERDEDGDLKAGTFLGDIDEKTSDHQSHAHMARLGVAPHQQIKQRLIDGDWRGACEMLMAAQEATYDRVKADPECRARLDAMPRKYHLQLTAHEAGSGEIYALHGLIKRREWRAACFRISKLTATSRQRLLSSASWARVVSALSPDERERLDGALRSASGPTLEMAGGDLERIAEVIARMPAEEKRQIRWGYLLEQRGVDLGKERGSDAQRAVGAYKKLRRGLTVKSGLDGRELDRQLDRVLLAESINGMPITDGALTETQRQDQQLHVLVADARLEEIARKIDAGAYDTDEEEGVIGAQVQFSAMYRQAKKDGQLSQGEIKELYRLFRAFQSAQHDHDQAVEQAIVLAQLIATIATSLVLTGLSGGLLAPANGLLSGQGAWVLGSKVLGGALINGAAQVAAGELAGGAWYDAERRGMSEFGRGVVEGAFSVLTPALTELGAELIGLSGKALSSRAALAGEHAILSRGQVRLEAAAYGTLKGAFDTALIEGVRFTAMELPSWEGGLRDAMQIMYGNIQKASITIPTGALSQVRSLSGAKTRR